MRPAQSPRRAQDQVNALELIQPILHDRAQQVVAWADDAGGANGPIQCGGHVAILRKRAVAVAADGMIVLTQEQNLRHARRPADHQFIFQIAAVVAIDVANIDLVVGRCNVVENGTLLDAIAALGARHDEHFHVSLEARQQLFLRWLQLHATVHRRPPGAVLVVSVLLQKGVVRQCLLEVLSKIHGDGPAKSGGESWQTLNCTGPPASSHPDRYHNGL